MIFYSFYSFKYHHAARSILNILSLYLHTSFHYLYIGCSKKIYYFFFLLRLNGRFLTLKFVINPEKLWNCKKFKSGYFFKFAVPTFTQQEKKLFQFFGNTLCAHKYLYYILYINISYLHSVYIWMGYNFHYITYIDITTF